MATGNISENVIKVYLALIPTIIYTSTPFLKNCTKRPPSTSGHLCSFRLLLKLTHNFYCLLHIYFSDLLADLATPAVEGIYETQVPLDFRTLIQIGAICAVDRQAARQMRDTGESFDLKNLNFVPVAPGFPYLDLSVVKYIYIYYHQSGTKSMIGVFVTPASKATIFVVDTVRTNQMPNMNVLYNLARTER